MPVNIGTLFGTLQLNAQGFLGGLTQVSGAFTAFTQKTESQASKFRENLSKALTITTGIQFAQALDAIARGLRDVVTESIKLGHEATIQEGAFRALTQSVGIHGDEMVRALQRASGATVNISDVMIQAGRAIVQGFQPDQIVSMMEVARQQSKLLGQSVQDTFNGIAEAIASGNTRALRPIAGFIDIDQAVEDFARKNGQLKENVTELGRTQALYEALMRKTADSTKALTGANADQKEMVERLTAAWKQLKEDIGGAINTAGLPALRWLQSMSGEFAGMGAKAETAWRVVRETMGSLGSLFLDVLPTLKAAGAGIGGFFLAMLNGVNVVLIPFRSLAAGISALVEGDFSHATERMTAAFNDQMAAAGRSSVALMDQITALGAVGKASDEGERSLKKFTAGLGELGKNGGVASKDMFKAPILDTEKLKDLLAGVKAQFDELTFPGSEIEASVLVPFKKALDAIKGMTPEVRDAVTSWAEGVAVAIRQVKLEKQIQGTIQEALKNSVQGLDPEEIFKGLDKSLASTRGESAVFGDTVQGVTADIEATTKAIKELIALGFSPASVEIRSLVEDLDALDKKLGQTQRMEGIGAEVKAAFAGPDAAVPLALLQVVKDLNTAIETMRQNLAKGGEGVLAGITGEIAALKPQLAELAAGFGEGSTQVQEFKDKIGALKVTLSSARLDEAFKQISGEGLALKLTGTDTLAAKIAAITGEIKTLLAQNDSTLEDRIKELSGDLEGLKFQFEALDTIKGVFTSIGQAFSQTVIGIQRGTQTLSQGFQNMAQSIVLSISDTLIKKGFEKLASAFSDMIDSMLVKQAASAAIGFVLRLFSSAVGPADTYQADPAQPHASGGLITRPTKILAGERGPEMVVPVGQSGLPKLWETQAMDDSGWPRGGGYGGAAVNIVIENHTPAAVEHTSEPGLDGQMVHRFIIKEVREGIGAGELDRDFRNIFGLARQGVRR